MARRAKALAIIIITTTIITTPSWAVMCSRRGGLCPPWANRGEPWHPLPEVRRQTAAMPHIHPTPWWARHLSSTRDPKNGRRRCEGEAFGGVWFDDSAGGETMESKLTTYLRYLGLVVKHTSCTTSNSGCWTPPQLLRSEPLQKLSGRLLPQTNWTDKNDFVVFHVCVMSIISLI